MKWINRIKPDLYVNNDLENFTVYSENVLYNINSK